MKLIEAIKKAYNIFLHKKSRREMNYDGTNGLYSEPLEAVHSIDKWNDTPSGTIAQPWR